MTLRAWTSLTLWSAALVVATPAWPAAAQPAPTFARDVAPIFYDRCTTCHRPGQIAPMSLLTYKDARPWSRSIRARVAARTMPPWFAGEDHRDLAGDLRLNDNEMMTILAWVDAGAPEGDPRDLPSAPAYAQSDWRIGRPDAVFQLPREFTIPPRGTVDIQHVEVPSGFTEDKWLQAIEVRPGDPAHVHHVLAYYRDAQSAGRTGPDDEAPSPGSSLAVYASGADPLMFPDGAAMRIPAGAVLVFEVHYTTNGAEGHDRTRLALRFARHPPALEVHTRSVSDTTLVIPPGEPNHRTISRVSFDEPVSILSITPHAHRRGKSFEYRLLLEDGRSETILSVPRYNSLWEIGYRFAEPVAVPRHAAIEITAIYDNSSANKANPDPKSAVGWGWDPISEEMMFSHLVFATPRKD